MRSIDLPQVDTSSPTLRYIQAKTILSDAIQRGTFPAGCKLPNTSEIGTRLNVSLITAHKAIQCLVEEGWLRRERGRGTFVRGDYQESVAAKPKFRVALVLDPTTVLMDFYHGVLLDSLRQAFEATESIGELVIQRCKTVKDLDRVTTDALICFHPPRETFPCLEQLARTRPVVVLGASTRQTSLYCVDSQNFVALTQAIRHLIELGHERIALVNGPLQSTNCFDRQQGYIDELRANNLEVRPEDIFNTNSTKSVEVCAGKIAKAMRSPQRPTAIVACSYYLALDVMVLLRRIPLKISEDVSLVGFDDPKSAALLNPSLTTIHQPLEEMAARAYQRIVQLIDGVKPSPTVELLPTSLVIRESTSIVS